MMSLSLRWALVLLGLWFPAAAHAQSLPPLPGSTAEYRAAEAMFRPEQAGKRLELMLAACQKKDAAGCYDLGQRDQEDLQAVLGMPPGAAPTIFVDQSLSLAKQWCAPNKGIEDGCETYRVFLSNFQSMRRGGDRILEGGRVLAKRCLAGKSRATDCSDVEKLLVGAPAERSALAAWADKQFEVGCASGDRDVCNRGFFRQYGGITEETAPRLERLVDASITGCNAGAAYVCFEAAAFLAGSDGPETYPLTADLFRAACKLPTRPGEEDVRDAACKNEALVRAAIAKGK